MKQLKQKLRNFYENNEDEIKAVTVWSIVIPTALVMTYLVITPFMVWWKKLGLYNK